VKAAFIEQTGAPEQIRYGELPQPAPATGEALVRIAAAPVNPVDTLIRSGKLPMKLPRPFVVGCDFSGTVTALGPDTSTPKPGTRVWGSVQGLVWNGEERQGTTAEFAVIGTEWLFPVPHGISERDAAAIGLPGFTAHLGLFRCAKLSAGETVFVNGGTGGVGSMVIQMAKTVGAKAITTVGSAEKQLLAQRLGADLALNYKRDDIPTAIRDFTRGAGVQVWYETLREPNFEQSLDLIAKRGRMIVIVWREAKPVLPLGKFYPKDLTLYGFSTFNATPTELAVCANDINSWLAEGKLKPIIGKSLPFSQAAEAHRLQEGHTSGKGELAGKILVLPDA
jgi:NADPH2:quinone reductase